VPELPEIAASARGMQSELAGKTITSVEVWQPKSLHLAQEQSSADLIGQLLGSWLHWRSSGRS
jgi:formamidopyrimidine-DNA glycosylase